MMTTLEQLLASQTSLQELEMKLNEEYGKVSSLNRRLILLKVSFGSNLTASTYHNF